MSVMNEDLELDSAVGYAQFENNAMEYFPTVPNSRMKDILVQNWSVEAAVREVVDNTVSTANNRNRSEVNLTVDYDSDEKVLVFTDNAGGVKREDMKYLLTLGSSGLRDAEGGQSQFGVGLKAAGLKLSNENYYAISRHEDADCTHGVRLADERESETGWKKGKYMNSVEELPKGTTKIVFKNVTDKFTTESFVNHIGKVYNKYLSEGGYKGLKLNLTINGEEVEPIVSHDFSYTPYWIYPQKYPRIKLDGRYCDESLDSPVYVTVTVGMLTNKNSEKYAGTDIYCQGILVDDNLKHEEGGFTSDIEIDGEEESIFGGFSTRRSRFKIILDFQTEGSRTVLPWDATKSNVRINGVWKEAFLKWAKNISTAYRRGYGELTAGHIMPFTEDHPAAVNNGNPEVYESYENNKRIRNGEKARWYSQNGKTGIKDKAKSLLSVVERHAHGLYMVPDEVIQKDFFPDVGSEEQKKAAYEELVLRVANSSEKGHWNVEVNVEEEFTTDDFKYLDEEPEELKGDSGTELIEKVQLDTITSKGSSSPDDEFGDWSDSLVKQTRETSSEPDELQFDISNINQSTLLDDTPREELRVEIKEEIRTYLNRRYEKIYELTIEDVDESSNSLRDAALGLTREEQIREYVSQMFSRSLTTSWGTTVENICKIIGAEEIPDGNNVGLLGDNFDLQIKINDEIHYIQLKSGTNTMNVGMVESLNDAITKIEENSNGEIKGFLCIASGKRDDVSHQIKSNLDNFESKAIVGDEFWEHLSSDKSFGRFIENTVSEVRKELEEEYEKSLYEARTEKINELIDEIQ